MSLRYDFYENPLPKDSNKHPQLHPRVVTSGTMNTSEMAKRIHGMSTLTIGDIKATLISLVELMADELASGKRIHLEGLGYFQLTLSSLPVHSPKEIRAESISVKSVVFRSEKSFKKRFIGIPMERVREKRHSNRYSDFEIEDLLAKYFLHHPHITRREFGILCGFTESTAKRRLNKLVADGKLQNAGYKNFPLYKPVEK